MDKRINKQKNRKNIKRFLPYYRRYAGLVGLDLFFAAFTTVCELALPMIVRQITDAATNNITLLTPKFILSIGGIYIILRLIDAAAFYFMATVGHITGAKIETDLRTDMFDHLQKLSFSYYDGAKIGSIMSRITHDLFDVTEFAHHCPEELFITGIKIIASFVILCTMSIPLTLIVFAVIPPMVIILSFFNKRMHNGFLESRRQIGELNAGVEDSLLGIRVVKSFTGEEIERKKFQKGNNAFLGTKRNIYKVMGAFQCSTRLFDGLMYIIVVVAGAFFMRGGYVSAADLVAFLLFVSTLLGSIRRIVEFGEQFQRGMTGIERFFEIMDIEPDITDRKGAKKLKNAVGDIEFCNVSFKYSAENEAVLNGFNMHIGAGRTVALVGPSGGGKTTVSSLIPRFYDVCDGCIKIDGTDIRDYTLRSLRQNIGIVQQDVYMFSGSVKDNIAYGKPGATDDEIRRAARLAGADGFITELPDGYDTYVGERGVKLSGGQKQRISIARVFLKDPPILILDEATSALDNESERVVQESLGRLSEGRTTLIIAHRLTTVKNADEILVIDGGGNVIERGSHNELLKSGGRYSELYKIYDDVR